MCKALLPWPGNVLDTSSLTPRADTGLLLPCSLQLCPPPASLRDLWSRSVRGGSKTWASLASPWVFSHSSSPVPGLKSSALVVSLHLLSPDPSLLCVGKELITGDVLDQWAQSPVLEIYSRVWTRYAQK